MAVEKMKRLTKCPENTTKYAGNPENTPKYPLSKISGDS